MSMGILRFIGFVILLTSTACGRPRQDIPSIQEALIEQADTLEGMDHTHKTPHEALLLTGYNSMAGLKSSVQIQYIKGKPGSLRAMGRKSAVRLTYRSGSREVTSILKTGISETDFMRARDGNIWDRLELGLRSPFAVINKKALVNIERLGRRRPWVYGQGDVAFYDLAETMVQNILAEDTTSMSAADLSEKGYLNTFNHITAQAFMTSIYTEALADFVADVHERRRMPELITGNFTEDQLADLENGPLDNYIDLLNNEWGQKLGKSLRRQYMISRKTYWTPQLMADYLNEIQSYYSWAFQIGFNPFRPDDDIVIRFARKINSVLEIEQDWKSLELHAASK
jgi:hypothetical protein